MDWKDPECYCPVCGSHIVWVGKNPRYECCAAIWAYCPHAEPYLIEVKDSTTFGEQCVKHGALDKKFSLMPAELDG